MASTPSMIFRFDSIVLREKQVNRIVNLFTNWSYFFAVSWGKEKSPRKLPGSGVVFMLFVAETPETQASSTWVWRISSGSIWKIWSSKMKSASLPGVMEPFRCSSLRRCAGPFDGVAFQGLFHGHGLLGQEGPHLSDILPGMRNTGWHGIEFFSTGQSGCWEAHMDTVFIQIGARRRRWK